MQAKSEVPIEMKPKQQPKLSKLTTQEDASSYEQTNKQIRLLDTDNTYFCVYGYD